MPTIRQKLARRYLALFFVSIKLEVWGRERKVNRPKWATFFQALFFAYTLGYPQGWIVVTCLLIVNAIVTQKWL